MLAEPIKSSHEYQVIFVVAILCVYEFKVNSKLIVNGLLMMKHITGGVELIWRGRYYQRIHNSAHAYKL